MAQQPNQFGMTGQKGLMDLQFNPSVISCEIDASEAGTLLHGQAVKIVDSAGGIPKVIAAASDTDDVFGFIKYDMKSQGSKAYDKVEVAIARNSVMYMEAGGAIARGGKVMILVAGQKVVAAVGSGKHTVGRTLDKSSADGTLVRVMIDLPGETLP